MPWRSGWPSGVRGTCQDSAVSIPNIAAVASTNIRASLLGFRVQSSGSRSGRRADYKHPAGREKKKARPLYAGGGPGVVEHALEVEGEVEPHDPRTQDRRRVEPGPAARRRVVVLRFVDGAVIRVEQVLQVDAD